MRFVVSMLGALLSALWISVCAAAPEFIWQGFGIAFAHPDVTDLVSALLVGLILAFFVEPLMDTLRLRLGQGQAAEPRRGPRNIFFAASLGLVFALVAVCLHDSLNAFVASHTKHVDEANEGIAEAITLTAGWAITPFATTLAWLAAPRPWVALGLAAAAAASPLVAGWSFAWSTSEIVTTVIPCLAILLFGFVVLFRTRSRDDVRKCARVVAYVGAVWLACAAAVDAFLTLLPVGFRFYTVYAYWTDFRFYLGWTLGLMVAPSAYSYLRARRQTR